MSLAMDKTHAADMKVMYPLSGTKTTGPVKVCKCQARYVITNFTGDIVCGNCLHPIPRGVKS